MNTMLGQQKLVHLGLGCLLEKSDITHGYLFGLTIERVFLETHEICFTNLILGLFVEPV